ncbi:MAG: DUF2267 domain-containing protein [Polyangiaceae bacterium]|nr:DUF2267 domain-containing protein [Polyangiaceae bacterium]
MSTTGVRGIDSTIQKTQEWLSELSAELGWKDRHRAYSALRAVLHAIRDRLPVSQTAAFGAQLPILIRGLYYDGWRPSDVPLRVRHREEFLDLVREELDRNQAITEDVEKVVAAAIGLLCRHNEAEMRKISSGFPKELQSLFPFGERPEAPGAQPHA